MKRLTIFKNASDFAFASLETEDSLQLDIDSAAAFKAANLPSEDYTYWKQCFQQCRQQFSMLNQQPSPSEQLKARAAAQQPQVPK